MDGASGARRVEQQRRGPLGRRGRRLAQTFATKACRRGENASDNLEEGRWPALQPAPGIRDWGLVSGQGALRCSRQGGEGAPRATLGNASRSFVAKGGGGGGANATRPQPLRETWLRCFASRLHPWAPAGGAAVGGPSALRPRVTNAAERRQIDGLMLSPAAAPTVPSRLPYHRAVTPATRGGRRRGHVSAAMTSPARPSFGRARGASSRGDPALKVPL
jgi:hypothetical protein